MTSSPTPYAPGPVAPVAPARRGSALPWVLVAVLAVVALVLGVLLAVGGGSDSSEQQGFATPEEAIEFSTEKIAEGDAAAALTAWAGDAQAENLDLVGSLERVRVLSPADASSLPSDDELFVELGQTVRAGTAADQYRRMAFSLLLPEVSTDSTTMLGDGDGDGDVTAQDVADGLDSERLAGLQAQRIDLVEGPAQYEEMLQELAALVGADERREYVVLYEWDGETYLGGVSVLRYGDDWQIETLASAMAGTANGALEPTTADEYDDLLTDLSDS